MPAPNRGLCVRAKGGQVSVHRPVTSKSRGRGPWCVDNLDGRGVTLNDDLFDWEEYPGPSGGDSAAEMLIPLIACNSRVSTNATLAHRARCEP